MSIKQGLTCDVHIYVGFKHAVGVATERIPMCLPQVSWSD